MPHNVKIIAEVCRVLSEGDSGTASEILRTQYPFKSIIKAGRNYTKLEQTTLFISDVFIDRYSEKLLIFPPVLRLLSMLLPEEFPFHSNWKMEFCHIAFWEYFPTID